MKKIINLVLIIFFIVTLSSCHSGSSQSGFEMPEEFDDSRTYEITFWAKNDSNISQVEVYKKAISDFEELYPNIKINISLYSSYSDIYNDVITNISTNTTPNVCITYPDHIATYITGSSTVAQLDELLVDEKYGLGGSELKFDGPKYDEVISEYLNEGLINGKYYAIPFMRSTEAVYINKDYVEKLGYEVPDILTWDFIFEVSEAALKKNDDGTYFVNNQNVLIPFIYKSTDNMMISMLQQLDAPYSDDDGNILIFNDTTKDILLEIAKHGESGAFSTFKISSYPANFLNAGQCIFAIDSTAGATWMGSDAPLLDIAEENIVEFETVVRMIPQYDVDNPKMISQGPSICVFNKEDNQEVLASWLFAQFLLTNDTQIAYSKTEGYVPVTTKAQNDSQYLDYINRSGEDNNEHYKVKIDAAKLLNDNVKNTFVTSVFNGSASLRTAAGQLIEETVKAVRRKKTVDDSFISELYDDINSLYRLDQISNKGVSKDLGELPLASKILLGSLASTWILIGIYVLINKNKNKEK